MKNHYFTPAEVKKFTTSTTSKLGIAAKQISVYFNAALADDAGRDLDRYLRLIFESGATVYDRAMDAGRALQNEYCPDHRFFDGGHSVVGAWEAVTDALPDDTAIEEFLGFGEAYWKDLVTPMGMPLATLSRDGLERVADVASRLGVDESWLKDLVSITATEVAGASVVGVVIATGLGWKKKDIHEFSEYAAAIGTGALFASNPLAITLAVLMVARSIHISRSQSRLQKTLERFGWGAAKAGAVIGTAAIIGGPAWLGIAAGIGASITLGRIQELSQTKGKGFDSSAMADKMHLLVQNQLMPKLSSPRSTT